MSSVVLSLFSLGAPLRKFSEFRDTTGELESEVRKDMEGSLEAEKVENHQFSWYRVRAVGVGFNTTVLLPPSALSLFSSPLFVSEGDRGSSCH